MKELLQNFTSSFFCLHPPICRVIFPCKSGVKVHNTRDNHVLELTFEEKEALLDSFCKSCTSVSPAKQNISYCVELNEFIK